jgi:hypothetical protein
LNGDNAVAISLAGLCSLISWNCNYSIDHRTSSIVDSIQ